MKSKQTMPSYLVQLEHELAAALRKVDELREKLKLAEEENNQKQKDIIWTMGERAKLIKRIERLTKESK
jgi:multidrug resistance efflux pump